MSYIIVDDTYCKGCSLCVDVCPEKIIQLSSDKVTQKGYRPAELINPSACTACTLCAQMCPDVAITVVKE